MITKVYNVFGQNTFYDYSISTGLALHFVKFKSIVCVDGSENANYYLSYTLNVVQKFFNVCCKS